MYWKKGNLLLVLLVVGSIGSTAYAQEAALEAAQEDMSEAAPSSTVADRLQDASLAARVRMALADDRSLRTYVFEPVAERSVVTLFGQVDTRAQYDRAAQIVRGVPGVADLVNELTVTSSTARISSPRDEDGAAASGALYHTVREGESLWIIARRYGTSISTIKRLSNLTSNTVRPGQRLRVR